MPPRGLEPLRVSPYAPETYACTNFATEATHKLYHNAPDRPITRSAKILYNALMSKSWDQLPETFLERLDEIIPSDRLRGVLDSYTKKRPTTLRVNTLKNTKEEFLSQTSKEKLSLMPVPWYDDAFIVPSSGQKSISDFEFYKRGFCYVQSLSSMIPPLVLDPKPGEMILDIAAAPGSKTTEMAMMMGNTGTIIANDNSKIREYKLEANLKMQGVTNTQMRFGPGQILWQEYPEKFDKALVDVPCSMEGTFSTTDLKSFEFWSTNKIKELVERQKWLLRSAISATKPGGIIVYSTCTLAPEENEGIIDWILRKEKGRVTTEPIVVPRCPLEEPCMTWKSKQFDEQVNRTKRIYPSELMEGFFVAKLRKTESTIPRLFTE